jgi:hypothetical protein
MMRASARSALQCDDFTRGIAKVELVVHRSHPSHALHGIDDIVQLVAQRHSAQRHLIVVREYLDSLPMLDTMVQLRAHARCELVICSRFLFHPVFRTFLRAVPCISQKQRCPDPEARDQSDLFSAICWHWSLISLLVGGQLTGNASGGPLSSIGAFSLADGLERMIKTARDMPAPFRIKVPLFTPGFLAFRRASEGV